MQFFQKSKSVNFQVNPLTRIPGGCRLTFLFKDGTYLDTHKLIKYPKQYALTVVNKYLCTKNPVVKVFDQTGVIYEKNNC
jgi:hypothetical protein